MTQNGTTAGTAATPLEAKALVDALLQLRKYAQHRQWCATRSDEFGFCTCGLSEARTALEQAIQGAHVAQSVKAQNPTEVGTP